MGATSPATVAGTVVLANAETLFGLVLCQLIKPGAPVVLKPDTDIFDMRTTQVTYGSPEQNLGKLAEVQLAHFYNLPIYGLGGGVEAKTPDVEAASEAAMTMLLNGLAGMTMSQSLGTLSFGQYSSQEMVVICDEIVHSIKRVLRGIDITDETLAVDVIRQVGHKGDFLQVDHTVQYFKQEMYFPSLFRRQTIEQWINSGAKMGHQVAHDKVLQILEKAGPVELPPGVDAEMERALQKAIRFADARAKEG
jgi:trimethylamine--corrinoid protein Co-methyltransferase